jgi:formate--tetrahydrofolate ligase
VNDRSVPVALNRFPDDQPEDLARIIRFCSRQGVQAVVAEHYARGGEGAVELAQAVLRVVEKNHRRKLRFLYRMDMPLERKIETLAQKLYGADGVDFDSGARHDLELLNRHGFAQLPVCIAKTPMSLSDDPARRGRPRGFRIKVSELRISAGAGFVVVICGSIVTMPGLPKVPAAARIKVLPSGRATGLTYAGAPRPGAGLLAFRAKIRYRYSKVYYVAS